MKTTFVTFATLLQHKTGLDNVHGRSNKCSNSSSYTTWALYRHNTKLVSNEECLSLCQLHSNILVILTPKN